MKFQIKDRIVRMNIDQHEAELGGGKFKVRPAQVTLEFSKGTVIGLTEKDSKQLNQLLESAQDGDQFEITLKRIGIRK